MNRHDIDDDVALAKLDALLSCASRCLSRVDDRAEVERGAWLVAMAQEVVDEVRQGGHAAETQT